MIHVVLFCSTAQHNVLNWQRHAARRMILHFLEVDVFYQVGMKITGLMLTRHPGAFMWVALMVALYSVIAPKFQVCVGSAFIFVGLFGCLAFCIVVGSGCYNTRCFDLGLFLSCCDNLHNLPSKVSN